MTLAQKHARTYQYSSVDHFKDESELVSDVVQWRRMLAGAAAQPEVALTPAMRLFVGFVKARIE
eukprot:11810325-Alexandrium_andersonii.AAC.1